jgi:hypothetical protein
MELSFSRSLSFCLYNFYHVPLCKWCTLGLDFIFGVGHGQTDAFPYC